jgi:hypothetical protein
VIGPGEAVAREVLAKHPLGVALVILHIEWMTQRHFLDSVVEDNGLDPMFKSLLKHHWMEECQHARLDELMVDALAEACGEAEIAKALDDYVAIGGFLDAGLAQQTEFDLASLETAIGRTLPGADRDRFIEVQHRANRWTFLGSGMTHPRFTATLATLGTGVRDRIAAIAPAFC